MVTIIMGYMARDKCREYEQEQTRVKLKQIEEFSSFSLKGEEEMKNIRQRVDGRWEWRKSINGERVSIIKRTQKQLLTAVKTFTQKSNKSKYEIKKSQYKLIDWLYYWLKTYKTAHNIKQKTIDEIERYFKNHIEKSEIATIKLSNLTTDTLQIFFNKMKPSRTKELVFTYVKASLKKAIGLGHIKYNLFEEFVPDAKIDNIAPPFSYDEQVKIWNALPSSDIEHVIKFYLLTGIRRNEIPKTKEEFLGSIDLQNNLLKIRCEKKRHNKIIYRYIDLSEATTKYFVENVDDIVKFNTDVVFDKFKKLLNRLNIEGNLKTLRHTYTTNNWYLRNPDKLISSWLGHETVELTQKVYIYIDRTITKDKILALYGNLYYLFK